MPVEASAANRARCRRSDEADPVDGVVLASRPLPPGGAGSIRLRIVARGGVYAFDFAPARGGWTRLLDGADGTILSTAKADGFVGVTIGMYAYAP